MIYRSHAEFIHQFLISEFGGASGIRDVQILESALLRPFQKFKGEELYNSPIRKAAALIESIVVNHPFVDGNKRAGYVLMRILLIRLSLDIKATEEEKYQFVIRIASGKSNFKIIFIQNSISNYSKMRAIEHV